MQGVIGKLFSQLCKKENNIDSSIYQIYLLHIDH